MRNIAIYLRMPTLEVYAKSGFLLLGLRFLRTAGEFDLGAVFCKASPYRPLNNSICELERR